MQITAKSNAEQAPSDTAPSSTAASRSTADDRILANITNVESIGNPPRAVTKGRAKQKREKNPLELAKGKKKIQSLRRRTARKENSSQQTKKQKPGKRDDEIEPGRKKRTPRCKICGLPGHYQTSRPKDDGDDGVLEYKA